LGFAFLTPMADASNSPSKSITYKGISLTPAIQNIEILPGQATASFKIKIENKQNTAVSLSTSSLDFKSLNETGGVAFIGNASSSLDHKYGLANWLILPVGPINLPPNTSQQVEVDIDNRSDLSPGGHYAAVLFKSSPALSAQNNKVNLNQVVSTLVFLKKTGGEIYSLQLQPPKLRTAWFHLPGSLDLFIKNTGNTQTAPRGIISIYGPDQKLYERGIVNVDSGLVLPDSTRFYKAPLSTDGQAWLPGRYKAVISYRAEDQLQAQTVEFSFIYINLTSCLLVLILITFIVTAIRYVLRRKK
jgi:hypothetical protein